jgi:hypothetical protein
MPTARDLITDAYVIGGITDLDETPSSSEINQGLTRLNGIIETLNNDNLWQYTQQVVTFTVDSSQSEYTIGDPQNGKTISNIEAAANVVTVTTSDLHGYSIGDTIQVYETENFDGEYTVATVPDSFNFTAAIATNPATETSGSTTLAEDYPDIVADRPLKVESMKVRQGNTLYPVRQYSMATWNMRSRTTANTGLPYKFQYIPNFPFGVIDFGSAPSNQYPIKMVYNFKIESYTLDSEVSLPTGYFETLTFLLADALCTVFGKSNPSVKSDAIKKKLLLERNNQQTPELYNSTASKTWYDYRSDSMRGEM